MMFLLGLSLGIAGTLYECLWRRRSLLRQASEHLARADELYLEIKRLNIYQRDAIKAGMKVLDKEGRKL